MTVRRSGRLITMRHRGVELLLFLPWTARHSFGRDFCAPTVTVRIR